MGRKTVCTRIYRYSHAHEPSGTGLWIFRNKHGGDIVNHYGTYGSAKAKLPPGYWEVCP